jgi:hypothetical protein
VTEDSCPYIYFLKVSLRPAFVSRRFDNRNIVTDNDSEFECSALSIKSAFDFLLRIQTPLGWFPGSPIRASYLASPQGSFPLFVPLRMAPGTLVTFELRHTLENTRKWNQINIALIGHKLFTA